MQKYVSVIGGINVDIKGLPANRLLPETSNPGSISTSSGGVGRNIAHNLGLLGIPVYLFGTVGNDLFGTRILEQTRQAGVNVEYIRVLNGQQTGVYLSILNPSHDLAVAISDMEITRFVDTHYLEEHQEILRHSSLIVLETNLHPAVLAYTLELCRRENILCLIEPVSVEKAKKLHALDRDVDYMTPNRAELEALCFRKIDQPSQLEAACIQLSEKCRHILVTLGKDGVYSYSRTDHVGTFYPPFNTQIVDPNGAGDAFVAGFVCGIFHDFEREACIDLGIAAAHLTLQSKNTVSEELSFERCSALIATKSRRHEEERS